MGDPIGIAASILTLISTGVKVAQGLYKLADGIGSAGQEVRVYADEIDNFSKLLQRVKSEIERAPSAIPNEQENLLRDIFGICERVLMPLKGLQNALNHLTVKWKESPGKWKQFGMRVQWLFHKKDKLLFYRAALRGQHRLLDTALLLMTLQTTRDRSSQNIIVLQLSLENSMTTISNSLTETRYLQISAIGPHQLENLPTSGDRDGAVHEKRSNFRLMLRASNSPQEEHNAELEDNAEPFSETSMTSNSLSVSSQYANEGAFEELNVEEVEQFQEAIREEVDASFEKTAQDIWEDSRAVSRKVLQYASDVLSSSNNDGSASTQDPDPIPAVHKQPQDPHPVPAVHQQPQDPDPVPSVHQQSSFEDRSKSQSVELAATDTSTDTINFQNANDSLYEFPLHEIRDWERMLETLSCLYAPGSQVSSDQKRAFQRGSFDILDPQGRKILPQYWSQLIKPNWTIKLEFYDDDLNASKLIFGGKNADNHLDTNHRDPEERALDLKTKQFELERRMFVANRKSEREGLGVIKWFRRFMNGDRSRSLY